MPRKVTIKPVPFTQAIDYAKQRNVVLPDVYYGKLSAQQRVQATTIAGLSQLSQIQEVIGKLNSVLENGGTFQSFLEDVEDGSVDLGLSKSRLDNIFRTNIQTSYNRGRYEQQSRNTALRPYLMYDAVNDGRTRPTHLAMDNVILPFNDPWWSTHYPPNGYRCRCTVISLTASQAKARGGVTQNPPIANPDEGFDINPGIDYLSNSKALLNKATTQAEVDTAIASAQIAQASKLIHDAAALSDNQMGNRTWLKAFSSSSDADFKEYVQSVGAAAEGLAQEQLRINYANAKVFEDKYALSAVLNNPERYGTDPITVDIVRAIRVLVAKGASPDFEFFVAANPDIWKKWLKILESA